LFADSLPVGGQEFRFETANAVTEVKQANVGTSSFTTLFFGSLADDVARPQNMSTLTVIVAPGLKAEVLVRARPLSEKASVVLPLLLASTNMIALADRVENPSNFSGDGILVNPGINVVTQGTWLLSAGRKDDRQESWFRIVEVSPGADITVSVAAIEYSDGVQLEQSQVRKAQIAKPLSDAKTARFWMGLGSWVSGVPAVILDAFWLGAVTRMIPVSPNIQAVTLTVVFNSVWATTAWWPIPDVSLQKEMDTLDAKIAKLKKMTVAASSDTLP